MWNTVLEERGVAVIPIDHLHVRLDADEDSYVFFVLTVPRLARPHDIRPAPEPHSLLIAPAITAEALERARLQGWSVVTDDGCGWVRLATRELHFDPKLNAPSWPKRRRGRPGRGACSVLRTLFALEGGATQEVLAAHARVTQAAVSKALARLTDLDLVTRSLHGWEVTNREGAISWWLANYPGPGGVETHWFGLDSIGAQAYRAYRLLDAEGARPVVSGDVAADLVVPWRTPRRATIYAERGADLANSGLTPSEVSQATLTLVLPQDTAVWPVSNTPVLIEMGGLGNVARANAFQVLYDLARSPGPDVSEALEAWRTWMLGAGTVT
jgi:hypothetical protein